MKFCIIIVPAEDGDRLLGRMGDLHFPATKVGSTGGFLKRGSVTIFSALEESEVPDLITMLHRDFPEVVESMPVATLPLGDDFDFAASAVDVRVGGAVVFVLPLDRVVRV